MRPQKAIIGDYAYDARNQLTSYTDAEGYTFFYTYDGNGNVVSETDGNGNTTRYVYDGLNRVVEQINAEGNPSTNEYDADGRMIKAIDEEGAVTAYTYDENGRLTQMTNALGFSTSFEYDAMDRVVKVTDAKGNATTYTYDAVGNVSTETNAKGVTTSYVYDANYNLTSLTDAAGTSTYLYDAMDRVVGQTDRRGNTQWFRYDAIGRITAVRDKNGNLTEYIYDGNGNIVKTIDALGTEAVFTYNKNDQLISMDLHRMDTVNNVDSHEITLYEYDGRNLVTKEINALGDSTLYVYDGNGNLVSKTDADGYVTEYSYTALDLVQSINYNGGKAVSYQYNKVGELIQMDDWTGTNTFELDLLRQLKKATDHKGNVTEYTYDEVGNQVTVKYPDGGIVSNFYDAVNNLTSVIDPDKGTYAYTYDDANRPVKLHYPNGWVEEYTYDAEGNLIKTVDIDPFQLYNKTPSIKFEYTYDAEGNVTHEFQRDSDAVENKKSHTDYTYDALNRLTGSTRKLEIYPYNTLSYTYTYDTLGNLLQEAGPTTKDLDTYQYNDLNQMTAKRVCGYEQTITRIHNYGYTYDKRGNLVKEEEICSPTTTGPETITIATYKYDETNRMVQGTNKAGEASLYTFNGLGVRVGSELILEDNTHGYTDFHCQSPSIETTVGGPHGPEVVKADYVIDYTRLDVDQRVLMKSEEDGYDFRYVYGLDKVQVKVTGEGSDWWGQNIQKCVNMAYVHTDRLGSVVNLSDQYGRVTARADYTDWGEVRAYTDITVDQGFRILLPELTYATHEYDDVLDQFYAKARMYDAPNKRFTAMDPLKGTPDNPTQYIQYLYVENAPITKIDPDGRMALTVVLSAGAFTLIAAGSVILFKGLQELCRTVADMVYPNLVDGYNRVINDINRGVRTFETYFESIQEYEEYTKTLTNIQDIGKFDQATIGAYVPSTSELEGELLDALGVGANTLERNELKSYIQSIKNSAYDYLVTVVDGSAIVTYAGTEDYKEYFTKIRCEVKAKVEARANQKLERGYCVYVLNIPPKNDVVYVGMTVEPERRLASHNASGKFGDKRVDLTVVAKATDKNDARAKEMFYMTIYFDELYAAAYNRIRSISPEKMGSDKYSNTVKVLAEMVGDITENELLCMLEETVPPGFGH